MNMAKQILVISVAIIAIHLFWIVSYFLGDTGFAYFWTSSGMAYGLLAFGVLTAIYMWHEIKHPIKD